MDKQKSYDRQIRMVDLKGQYEAVKSEIDAAMAAVIENTAFINGPAVKSLRKDLAEYLEIGSVITCGNGTDALQIALMSLGLHPGDEVIVPAFTYIASAEVIALLGLRPVLVDVDKDTFNISMDSVREAWNERCRAIIPVHLFGQAADMQSVMDFAREKSLYVIEDNAQSFGAECLVDGKKRKTGTIGHVGCTSFFPSKILGCYGDGGALMTDDAVLGERLEMIANHGQKVKYHHDLVGCNSRLDTIQAAVLGVKLKHIDQYIKARKEAASYYLERLSGIGDIVLPKTADFTDHVYHQFTLRTESRDELKAFLQERGIPSMVYYPLPLHRQKAFASMAELRTSLHHAEELSRTVLSLPIHTEMRTEEQEYICAAIADFYRK